MNRDKYDRISAIVFLIVVLAAIVTLLVLPWKHAQACVEAPQACVEAPQGLYIEYDDPSVWAVVDEFNELSGLLFKDEKVVTLPAQHCENPHVRGFLDNGMIRVANDIRVLRSGDRILGLRTLNNVKFRLRAENEQLAIDILKRILGEDAELCAGSISTCLLYMDQSSGGVCERFAPSWLDWYAIGEIFFNLDISSTDRAVLAVADWDRDGFLEFVIPVGWTCEEETVEESSEVETTDTDSGSCSGSAPVAKKVCWKLEFHLFDFLFQRCEISY